MDENLNARQKSSWGGKRPGAGRKSSDLRLKQLSYVEKRKIFYETVGREDFRVVIKKLVEKAKKGDTRVAVWLIEQIIGKPVQPSKQLDDTRMNIIIRDYDEK